MNIFNYNIKLKKTSKFLLTVTLTLFFSTLTYAQKGNTWIKKNYNVSGSWSIQTNDDQTFLVLHKDFKTAKGPDLKLFITKKTAAAINKNEPVEKHGILLGELTAFKGEQRFLIPDGVMISDYKSIVVHCEKYTKVWGAATL